MAWHGMAGCCCAFVTLILKAISCIVLQIRLWCQSIRNSLFFFLLLSMEATVISIVGLHLIKLLFGLDEYIQSHGFWGWLFSHFYSFCEMYFIKIVGNVFAIHLQMPLKFLPNFYNTSFLLPFQIIHWLDLFYQFWKKNPYWTEKCNFSLGIARNLSSLFELLTHSITCSKCLSAGFHN